MDGWASKEEVREWVEKLVRERLKYKPKHPYEESTLLQCCTIKVGKKKKTFNTEDEAIEALYHE